MQRVKSGFADDDFRFINAAPIATASVPTPTGAAPGPTHLARDDAPLARPLRQRLHCTFYTAIPWKIDMKITSLLMVVIVPAALLVAGCCANQTVAQPKSITFVQAMHDVGQGLVEMKAAEIETLRTNSYLRDKYGKTDFVTGLFPSEIEITFNVTASAANASQLSVDLNAAAAQSPVNASLGGKLSASASAMRANQITIKFVSALFAKTSTTTSTNGRKVVEVEGVMDPEKLAAFLDVMDKRGAAQFLIPPATDTKSAPPARPQ